MRLVSLYGHVNIHVPVPSGPSLALAKPKVTRVSLRSVRAMVPLKMAVD
jgi:hypothetical protein